MPPEGRTSTRNPLEDGAEPNCRGADAEHASVIVASRAQRGETRGGEAAVVARGAVVATIVFSSLKRTPCSPFALLLLVRP